MIKIIKTDKINRTAILEITKDDLQKIIDSIHNMADKQQRTLLENLPSEESDRRKLEDYKGLGENLTNILDVI